MDSISVAKKWDTAKQASILPMLLRGKLFHYYIKHDVTTKADLKQLKLALSYDDEGGACTRPLTDGKKFISCCQYSDEKTRNCAADLKKLFKQTYPKEKLKSGLWSTVAIFPNWIVEPSAEVDLRRGEGVPGVPWNHPFDWTKC